MAQQNWRDSIAGPREAETNRGMFFGTFSNLLRVYVTVDLVLLFWQHLYFLSFLRSMRGAEIIQSIFFITW